MDLIRRRKRQLQAYLEKPVLYAIVLQYCFSLRCHGHCFTVSAVGKVTGSSIDFSWLEIAIFCKASATKQYNSHQVKWCGADIYLLPHSLQVMTWLMGLIRNSFLQNLKLGYISVSLFLCEADYFPYPENLSGDICYPVFFQGIPFCVLHKVCDRASSTKLHNKLQNKYQCPTNIKYRSQLFSKAK